MCICDPAMQQTQTYFFSQYFLRLFLILPFYVADHRIDDARAKSLSGYAMYKKMRMDQGPRHTPKCRFNAWFDLLIAHDETVLLITRYKHDPFINPRIEL